MIQRLGKDVLSLDYSYGIEVHLLFPTNHAQVVSVKNKTCKLFVS